MSTPHGSIMIGSAGSNTASRRTGHANVEPNANEGGIGITTGSEATLSSPEHRSSSSCVSRKSAKFLVLPFGVFGVFAKTPASFDSVGIATQPAFAARSKGDCAARDERPGTELFGQPIAPPPPFSLAIAAGFFFARRLGRASAPGPVAKGALLSARASFSMKKSR